MKTLNPLLFFAIFTVPVFGQMEMPLLAPVVQSNLVTSIVVEEITGPSLANPNSPYVISASYTKKKSYSSDDAEAVAVSAQGRVSYLFTIQVPVADAEARIASFTTNPPPAQVQAWLQSVGREPSGLDAALVLIGQEVAGPAIAAMQQD